MKKHWFWSSLSTSKGLYFDVFLASFLLNIFMLATPLFTMNVYDRVVPNSAFDTLWVFVVAIVTVYVFDLVMKILRTYTLEVVAKKSDILISSRIFEQVLEIKLASQLSSVGAFASHLKEFESIRAFFTATSMATLIDLPFSLIFLGVIWLIGGDIVFVPIFATVVILLYGLAIKYFLKKSMMTLSRSSAKKNSILIESLSTKESIKSFSLHRIMQDKWEDAVSKMAKDEIHSRLLSSSVVSFSNFVIQLSTVAILVLGVYAIAEQSLSMGGLIALMMLSSRTLAPLNQFTGLIINYEQAKVAYKQLNKIMNMETDRETIAKVQRNNIRGSIEFQNVKFKYPNSKNYILDNVSFKIKAGEKVGIIGTNSSGKSTILKLIMGLYEPESGIILIDGVNIAQFDRESLQKNLAYLPQELVLFRDTLEKNIRNTVDKLSDEALLLSTKLSGLEEFVAKSSEGYAQPIQERGAGLSGGEKQAIGLARVFAKSKAKVLLLDEPSNAMDSNKESLVMKNLAEFSNEKTVIMVTHKTTFLKLSERLILLEKGRVLLDGSYEKVVGALSVRGNG